MQRARELLALIEERPLRDPSSWLAHRDFAEILEFDETLVCSL
jgi:hypothetical protein